MNSSPTILVVDDESSFRKTVARMLREQDYDVIETDSGEDALTIAEELGDAVDVILLDIALPGNNGFEVLRTLSENPQTAQIKVIMLTGILEVKDKVKALSTGAVDYLEKPFRREELIARIQMQVKLKRAEASLRASELKYENVVERAGDAIFIVQDGVFKFANNSFKQLLKYPSEELIGMQFEKTLAHTSLDLVKERYQKRISGETVPSFYEIEIIDKEGQQFSVEVNAGTIDFEGQPADLVFLRDITERKAFERELAESEQLFRTLFEVSPDPILILDTGGTLVDVNNAFSQKTKFTKEEVIGLPAADMPFIKKDDIQRILHSISQRMTGEAIAPYTLEIVTKGGESLFAEIAGNVIIRDGESIGEMVIARDITEHKKVQEALQRERNFLASVLQSQQDAVFVTDTEGTLIQISEAGCTLLGYDNSELIGQPATMLLSPDRLHEMVQLGALRCFHGERITPVELVLTTKHGEEIPMQFTGAPIMDERGKVIAAIGVGRDLREQTLAQATIQRMNTVLNAIFDSATSFLIATTDLEGTIISWNKGAMLLTGYTLQETVNKMNISQFLAEEESQSEFRDSLRNEILTKSTVEKEIRYLNAYGQTRIASMTATSLKDSDGSIMGVLTIAQDITKRKQAEEELVATQEALREINLNLEDRVESRTAEVEKLLNQKEGFINQLGHDLRSPLTPMVGLMPTLRNQVKEPKAQELLDVFNRNIQYMKNLVEKTVQLAKLNSTDVRLDINNINLLDALEDILGRKEFNFSNNNISIENNVDREIDVAADSLRLVEVLDNLTSNAVKFMPNGGTLSFDARTDETSVTISVKDSGIGIEENQIGHVFDEFFKADSSRHELGSAGLGLSICKQIIENQGGEIWVESDGLGQGTTFFFTVPLYAKESMAT